MRKAIIDEVYVSENGKKTASIKPREDISRILQSEGFDSVSFPTPRIEAKGGTISKVLRHLSSYLKWKSVFYNFNSNDIIVIQYPPHNVCYFLHSAVKKAVSRGVRVIFILHDVETLRWLHSTETSWLKSFGIKAEEYPSFKSASLIVVHNHAMKTVLSRNCALDSSKIVELGLFDYLFDSEKKFRARKKDLPIVVAGSLSRKKAGYLKDLPSAPRFNLYGVGYEDSGKENVSYKGSYLADELPYVLEGSFGLVWDGDSATTCSGASGSYLKVNNPHKLSLYLASELPVIVWKESAVADFVLANKIGLAIESLNELGQILENLRECDYASMIENVKRVSVQVRTGVFTKRAIDEALARLFYYEG